MPYPKLLRSTDLTEVSPLSPGGQPLFRNFEVLERELSGRLSQMHASLFAEPQISEAHDAIDWYGPAGSYRQLGILPLDEQLDAQARLASYIDELNGLVEILSDSDDPESQYLARLVDLALRIPSEDCIYVGPNGPILTDWGMTARGAATEQHVLRVLRESWSATSDEASGTDADPDDINANSPATIPISINQEPPMVGERITVPDWLYVASLVLTIILALGIGRLLLGACGIAMPWGGKSVSGEPLISFCETRRDDQSVLMNLIGSYEREIVERRAKCNQGGNPSSDNDEPSPETPEPQPEPTPQEEPPEPVPPKVRGLLKLTDLRPNIGKLCAIAICNPGGGSDTKDAQCERYTEWAASVKPDVPNGYCRFVLYPVGITADPGTRFTGQAELLVNEQPYKSWPVEGVTYPPDLLDALERSGRPRLYWVTDFKWPPQDVQSEQGEK